MLQTSEKERHHTSSMRIKTNSYRTLVSDWDSRNTIMEVNSAEYKTLQKCTRDLRLAVKSDLLDLSGALFSAGLITQQNSESLRRNSAVISPDDRAAELVDLILDKVKQDPQHYHTFVDTVKAKMDSTYHSGILRKLQETYSQCHTEISVASQHSLEPQISQGHRELGHQLSDAYYCMDKTPHGLCVIINNERFDHPAQADRGGANIDLENLQVTFQHLHYEIELHMNLTHSEMVTLMLSIAQRNHEKCDSFICCILSHGNQHMVYGVDSIAVHLEELIGIVKVCSTLKHKPKIFFIQACRNQNHIQRSSMDTIEQDSGESDPLITTIPQEADFFIGYATCLGRAAYRSPNRGSWYISELCNVLKKDSYDSNLDEMMVKVNDNMYNAFTDRGAYKQSAEFVNRLRKNVHFFQSSASQSSIPTSPAMPADFEDICELPLQLFEDEYPYKLFKHDNLSCKILELVVVFFLVFQTIASMFITICEEEGLYAVFHDGLNMSEFVNRIMTLLLRFLARVLIPFIFYRQLYSISKSEKRLEKKERKENRKQHVSLISIVSHAVMFSAILLYLGAFLTVESRLKGSRMCIKELFQIQIPVIGMQFFVFMESLATFFILMLVGLVKDCYCIQNCLSTEYNSKYFEIIRKRWYRLDIYCYTIPVLLLFLSIISLFYNRPITPVPDHLLTSDELEIWCFWTFMLSLLLFLGSSSNQIAKVTTVIGNILALCFAFYYTVFLGDIKVTFPPGTTIILLYSHVYVTTFNLLLCLFNTHYRRGKLKTNMYFWLSLLCLVLLTVSFCIVSVREVITFAKYVEWPNLAATHL